VAAAKVEKQKPTQPSVVAAAPVTAKKVRAESPQPEMPVQSAPAPEPVKVAATTPRDASPLPAKQIRELTPYQRAENEYRRASGLSMQGRTSEAMAALEQALQIDPRHAAARQMHAGMLVEAGRTDEAIASLKAGIALDQTQPSLAMSLARLQVEKGDAKGALETLRGGLPYAADFADYHAFLGALLQRQELHKEAVDEYGAALRLVPQNGLWWMGMGISLQADNRPKEARDAYQRAKAANTLSAELQSFVDQKLAQLPK
jgi:MSHA biogenesis protein MshN